MRKDGGLFSKSFLQPPPPHVGFQRHSRGIMGDVVHGSKAAYPPYSWPNALSLRDKETEREFAGPADAIWKSEAWELAEMLLFTLSGRVCKCVFILRQRLRHILAYFKACLVLSQIISSSLVSLLRLLVATFNIHSLSLLTLQILCVQSWFVCKASRPSFICCVTRPELIKCVWFTIWFRIKHH